MLYVTVERLRFATWPDPWHKLWNDCVGVKAPTSSSSSPRPVICFMGLGKRRRFSRRWPRRRLICLSTVDAEDALLMDLAPDIAAELKAIADSGDGQKQRMVQQLRVASSLEKRGAHISPTRRFDWDSHVAT